MRRIALLLMFLVAICPLLGGIASADPSDYTINLSGPTNLTDTSATFTAHVVGTPNTSPYIGLAVYAPDGNFVKFGASSPTFVNVDGTGNGTYTDTVTNLSPGSTYYGMASITSLVGPPNTPPPPISSNKVTFTTTGTTPLPTGAVGVIGFALVVGAGFGLQQRRRHARLRQGATTL